MATNWYNRGLYEISQGQRWDTATLKCMILATGTPYTFNKDHDFVSDVVASEASGTGYTGGFSGSGRKTVATPTVTLDDTNDLIKFDADDIVWTSASAGTWDKFVIYRSVTTDGDSPIWVCGDPTDLVTNGGNVTLVFNASGIVKLQN